MTFEELVEQKVMEKVAMGPLNGAITNARIATRTAAHAMSPSEAKAALRLKQIDLSIGLDSSANKWRARAYNATNASEREFAEKMLGQRTRDSDAIMKMRSA